MKRILLTGLILVSMPFLGLVEATPAVEATAGFDEGIEYQVIDPPQATGDPKHVEVVELFWYGCPHCYQLEPLLKEWLKNKPADVDFVRMPAILGPRWELLTRAYYTAELLGVTDEIHQPLFAAIHDKRRAFRNEDDLAKFFAEHGVDEKAFRDTYNSFGVAAKVNRSREMTKRYGITGVPTMVVNGKYRTSASTAGSHELMLTVVDKLVDQEREALAKADAQ
jgi:thiol:disulfide interchange protein DsbA